MPVLILTSVALTVALYIVLEIGCWLARKADTSEAPPASGVVFAVFGLLVAFTFTNSAERFNERRELIVAHANAFDTAWSRLDVLPEADREAVRRPMREWVNLVDRAAAVETDEEVEALESDALRLQDEAWSAAVDAVKRAEHPVVANIVLPPLNTWSDLTTTRRTRDDMGLPPLVSGTLMGLALLVALVAGYAMTQRGKPLLLHKLAFAIAIGISLHMISDLNTPRQGFIELSASDRILIESRDRVNANRPDATAAAPDTP